MAKTKTKIGHLQRMWFHIRRSPFQSLAAFLVMWLNFLLVTLLAVLIIGFGSLLNYFQARPEVTAYLKDEALKSQVEQLQTNLQQMEGIKEVRFVSKQEALELYREQNKDNPLLLEMVSADILPASLEISAEGPKYLNAAAETLKSREQVIEEVVYQKDVVENLSFWTRVIRNGGLGAVGFLTFVSLAVIMVIIGMKLATHRQEIKALRSLGATGFYIQAPYLLEGLFYGFWGSIIGSGIIFGALYYWQDMISSFFSPIMVIPTLEQMGLILGLEMAGGLFLGLVAASLATSRYLKK
jgi:cell division transport system permease protein